MKKYYRIMLGRKSVFANECLNGNFIGTDFGISRDLSKDLTDTYKDFSKKILPTYLSENPDLSKVSAGLRCGFLWTVSKYLEIGDIVLCPNGEGSYLVGEIISNYYYKPNEILPHRRNVKWLSQIIKRTDMSQKLQNSTGSIGTASDITKYGDEIEKLLSGISHPTIISTDLTVEDPSTFALEEHLEEFLIKNWKQTELGKSYDIYEEEGEVLGQQFPTETGKIDILAVSKNKKELLIVELKRGRTSDSVVGQIQRYMGDVQEELAEDGQIVKGVIIAAEDDLKIRRALSVTKNIEFFCYHVTFKLSKII